MLIFKDIITGDELFTDSNPVELVDDCLYEVKCQFVTRKHGDIVLDGANPSAEGEDGEAGGSDEHTESGLDLVLNQKLTQTEFDKKSYITYLKSYGKALQAKWKEQELTEEQLTEYKEKFTAAVKLIVPKLAEAEYYLGESMNPDGMVAVLEYRTIDDVEYPIMIFFKHGLEREKV